MTERQVRFAAQTYSWQMSNRWGGRLSEIATVVAQAGFAGIEPEVRMMDGFHDVGALQALLTGRNVSLAAIALVLDWRGPTESAVERGEANRVIDLLGTFEDARLVLVQMPSSEWTDRRLAQEHLVACMSAVARRATDRGIVTTFHPNSPSNSIVRTQVDYDRVLPKLPPYLGWTPDTGHLAVGGMDSVHMIRDYRELVNHIHLKDADGEGRWVPNGQGAIDLIGSVRVLAETSYQGWVVVEDESPSAESDPNSAAFRNEAWIKTNLQPLFD
jgi:inosose dehydratase